MRGTRIGDKSLALGLLALMWWRNISRLHSFPQFSLKHQNKIVSCPRKLYNIRDAWICNVRVVLGQIFLTLLINLHDVQTTRFLHDFKRHCNSFHQTSFSYVRSSWQGIYRFQQVQITTNDVLRNKFLDLFSYVKRDLKKQSNVFLFCCVNYPCNILRRPAPTPYM